MPSVEVSTYSSPAGTEGPVLIPLHFRKAAGAPSGASAAEGPNH
jgi:hypothetical protein